jgi:phosphatidylglycerophosphate synthase
MHSEQAPATMQTSEPSAGPSPQNSHAFVVALLIDLQRGRYTPRAWWRFFADAWGQSWQTAQAHPALKHSWRRVTGFILLLGLLGWVVLWLVDGPQRTLRVAPALALCLVVQQSDVFVHLGLNLGPDGRLCERLGLPTTLTLVRGVLAELLIAHLLRGLIPLPALTLGVYLLGLATDLVDGPLARRTGRLTRLGGYLDGEADLFLSAAVTLSAWLAGRLPGWFVAAMLLRFVVLIAGALFSYFVTLRQVDFSHTRWGRLAGTGQALCLLVVLLPGAPGQALAPLVLPLLLVTLGLAVLVPMMVLRQHLRFWRSQEAPMRR